LSLSTALSEQHTHSRVNIQVRARYRVGSYLHDERGQMNFRSLVRRRTARTVGLVLAAILSLGTVFGFGPSAYAGTTTDIVNLTLDNVGKKACSTNSLGGLYYGSSCTGDGGKPEFWCADFAKWVWAHEGVDNTSDLTAAAHSFYTYGREYDTFSTTSPSVGDAAVFSTSSATGFSDIHHVALVVKVSGSTVEVVSGDWGGTGSGSDFAGSSHVVHNSAFSSSPGHKDVMGMYLVGFVSPVGTARSRQTIGDFDADGHTDLALYRPNSQTGSTWWVKSSRTGAALNGGTEFGGASDIPAAGDYDGDGYSDLALYRRDCSNGSSWWVKSSHTGATLNGGTKFGGCTDIPAPGDYNGDGRTDLALYRPNSQTGSTWWVKASGTGEVLNGGTEFGGASDIPAPGDYDGDGRADLALFRRDCSNGSSWWVKSSRTGALINGGTKFGGCTDIPAPGDYDGKGSADLALYRRDCTAGSSWWVKSSETGAAINGGTKFGGCADIPVTRS